LTDREQYIDKLLNDL